MKNLIISMILSVMIVGCPVITDTSKQAPDISYCGAAEQHLNSLCTADPVNNKYCCTVVAPTKKGKSFTQFCTDKENEGIFLNPKCLSTVTSCSQIDACTSSN